MREPLPDFKIQKDAGYSANINPRTVRDCSDCAHDAYHMDGDGLTGTPVFCKSKSNCVNYHLHTQLQANGGTRTLHKSLR